MKFIFWIIVIGIVLRMIGNFFRSFMGSSATNERLRQMQEQMKDMHSKMNDQTRPVATRTVKKEGDYIDYEEIK